MQTYIINPMWFYWISVAGTVKVASAILLSIATMVFLTWVFIYCSDCSPFNDEERTHFEKCATRSGIALAALALLSIFVPSKETLISMMVAKFATYDNAQWTADAIKSIVDYIIEAFKAIG